MKPLTIVIPYSRTITWLQIVLCSLQENTDPKDVEIFIMNNGPDEDESLKGTKDFTGIEYWRTPAELRSHAGCMDYVLKAIRTPYFMMLESDCRIYRKDWLQNFLGAMKDPLVAMAGWYWDPPGGDRFYIGPGATIYNTEIVKRIQKEVRADNRLIFPYGNELQHRKIVPDAQRKTIEDGLMGPFQEFRSRHDIYLRYDEKWWMEPCAWLFYRCRDEFECVKLPGYYEQAIVNETQVVQGTHYGYPDTYLTHFWGGTVSYDWQKHPVKADWQLRVLPWWIDRERKVWDEVVPEPIRKKTIELGLVFDKEYILNHKNIKGENP